ncbi:MAG: hypothetical protein KC656_26650, partial [Myxococcales bacterium]|nr:hypothetical protein [Myxococcales bacterium]
PELHPTRLLTVGMALSTGGCIEYGFTSLDADPDLPGPYLQITPEIHDFGTLLAPCVTEVDLELANIGSATLEITAIDYSSFGWLVYDDRDLALPLLLEPGEAVDVGVVFEAQGDGTDDGVLEVTSNDPRTVVTALQSGDSLTSTDLTQTFITPGRTQVDVLWTIDQSRSMQEDNQDDIRLGVPGLLAELERLADYHLIQVTHDSGCANVGVFDASTPNAEALLVQHAFDTTRDQQSTTEQLLLQADVALQQTGPGGCNAGFLRDGARLHVIVASDEHDQSPQDHAYWLARYATHVSDPSLLTVSAVVDVEYACGDGTGPGEYLAAAEATGGRVLDICSPGWGAQLDDLAAEGLADIGTYVLDHPAEPGTVEVYVNGAPTAGFTLGEDGRTVVLDAEGAEGDEVVIDYTALATCPT